MRAVPSSGPGEASSSKKELIELETEGCLEDRRAAVEKGHPFCMDRSLVPAHGRLKGTG